MNKQFTASEVRKLLSEYEDLWIPRELCGEPPDKAVIVMQLFRAYADLLEELEKAVPVAYAEFANNGCVRMWSRGYEERLPGTRMVPLYTHSAPADAERLAEAVRNGLIDALRHQRRIDEDGAEVGVSREAIDDAAAILSALAAHSAQAQPPAASVPGVSAQAHEKAQAALAAQESPNG